MRDYGEGLILIVELVQGFIFGSDAFSSFFHIPCLPVSVLSTGVVPRVNYVRINKGHITREVIMAKVCTDQFCFNRL